MKRRSTLIVLMLVVLLALALLFHRGPRELKPTRPPKPPAVSEPPAPEPQPLAVEPTKPLPPRIAPPPPPPKPVELPPVVLSEAIKPGTIRGVVKILGVPPKRKPLRID